MSEFSTDFAEAFAEAADDAGFRVECYVRPRDCEERPFSMMVAWHEPDLVDMLTARQSKEFEIEFVATDAPLLREGDEVEVGGTRYTVRRAPFVSGAGEGGIDGTFRRAVLTRIPDDCAA